MLEARAQLARQLGHKSYAHYVAKHGRMETDPQLVCGKLATLCARLKPRVEVELKELGERKGGEVREGPSFDSHVPENLLYLVLSILPPFIRRPSQRSICPILLHILVLL